jgi:LPXTG-motif cell wall-anchored protein
LRRGVAASISFVLAVFGALAVAPSTAWADGPTTFASTASIAIPATGSANQIGPASPYPSAITVAGMSGVVTAVQVVFHNLTHGALNDVDAMVVAPSGQNLVVLSDIGDPTTLAFTNNATLTFDDAAAGAVPTGNVPTGTYRPTNSGTAEAFPAPAPAPSAQTTLTGAFTGINPNGTWQLFIVDDATGDVGSMAGGWSLVITTEATAVPTTTVVSTSGSPSPTGSPVTFTATVTASGSPVTAGTVAFTADGTPLGTVAVNASGVAQVTTSALAEGTHAMVATYSGTTGFLTSNGSVSQRVDNATVVTGSTYCNTGPLTIPGNGPATPYPSNITVSGLAAPVSKVTATLNGLSHSAPVDLDVMLSSPAPATNLVLMSDVGGAAQASGLTLVFDDDAAGPLPTPLTSGTFRPTDDDLESPDAAFPAPAPVVSAATTLATFNGSAGNGVWSLWVVDDATGDAGSISGGWCLTFTTASPTTTALTSDVNPSTVGEAVTFTATVTSEGAPVTTGTIAFSDAGNPLGGGIPIAADGTATLTTSILTAGTHPITATYTGTPGFATSTANLDQVVGEPIVADAGGPYAVAEGGSLTLDGSGSTAGATFAWDLNADGDFSDATGPAPTLSWAQLEALGIDDGPSAHTISLTVTLGVQEATDTADLDVTNMAPDTVVTGVLTATAGVPFTIKVGADDPSSADMAALFEYTVDWGDGSPIVSVTGPADPPVEHTYAAAGTYTASLTATDKDAGTSEPLAISVLVDPAAPTPSPAPSPTGTPPPGGALPPTGADSSAPALAAGLLILVGAGMLVSGRRRRASHRS